MPVRLRKARTVYKKVLCEHGEEAIAVLYLPRGTLVREDIDAATKFCSLAHRKNRASRAKVLRIRVISTGRYVKVASSLSRFNFEYRIGETIHPDAFAWSDMICASGIHFFRDRQDAKEYIL